MTATGAGIVRFDPAATAASFIAARKAAKPLPAYPGIFPSSLADAYVCQDDAIRLWGDEVRGWKIGRIPPDQEALFGAHRLAGPIFAGQVQIRNGVPPLFPMIAGGFGAVEAEFLWRIEEEIPAVRKAWSMAAADKVARRLFIGLEMAGSPFPGINDHGPAVTVSDFGNNAGLIVGPEIPDWRHVPELDLTCETWIDGVRIGRGGAGSIPGGPLESLRFLLENLGARGHALKPGDWISTGAATGVHAVQIGQKTEVRFGRFGRIPCDVVTAAPMEATRA